MTEDRFRELLYKRAEATVRDIADQFGGEVGDYEIAVRVVLDGAGDVLMLDAETPAMVGLVYMGEYGHWWYAVSGIATDTIVSFNPSEKYRKLFAPVYELES